MAILPLYVNNIFCKKTLFTFYHKKLVKKSHSYQGYNTLANTFIASAVRTPGFTANDTASQCQIHTSQSPGDQAWQTDVVQDRIVFLPSTPNKICQADSGENTAAP